MDDPPAAFGIYSYSRHPSLSRIEAGTDGTIHPNGLFFWQDRYYVDIRQLGSSDIASEDFLALARAIEKGIGRQAAKPEIVTLLPSKNMVAGSAVFERGR